MPTRSISTGVSDQAKAAEGEKDYFAVLAVADASARLVGGLEVDFVLDRLAVAAALVDRHSGGRGVDEAEVRGDLVRACEGCDCAEAVEHGGEVRFWKKEGFRGWYNEAVIVMMRL